MPATATTREAILERAADLASTDGLEGLTIGHLATELRMSKSGVFAHFGSKQELQLATVQAAADRFLAGVIAPAQDAEPGLPRLRRYCDGYLDHMHSDYPRTALMITEFGAEANRHGAVTGKGTYEFQSDFLDYHLRVFARKPFINGAIVWSLHDFRVKPGWAGGNPLPHPPVNEKGLIDDSGFRKPAFATVRQVFRRTGPFR